MPESSELELAALGVSHLTSGHGKTACLFSVRPGDWLYHSRMAYLILGEVEALDLSLAIRGHSGRRSEAQR